MLLRAVFTEVSHVQLNGHWRLNGGEYENYKSYLTISLQPGCNHLLFAVFVNNYNSALLLPL